MKDIALAAEPFILSLLLLHYHVFLHTHQLICLHIYIYINIFTLHFQRPSKRAVRTIVQCSYFVQRMYKSKTTFTYGRSFPETREVRQLPPRITCSGIICMHYMWN